MRQPKIGLVTVLYNGIEVLEGFFESLKMQTYQNYVLYVIDNSPDNKALDEAKRRSDKFGINSIFINNNDNLGVAKGNNQGIIQSLEDHCEYVLLLNNDIEFSEGTIKDMVDYAEAKDEKMIVPKIYYYGTNKIWMAGGHISKFKGISPHRGSEEEDIGQYEDIEYINYAPTCFMLIKRDVFNKIGFMDEKYFVYYDDTDFVWRANEAKFKLVYFPKVTVAHKVSFSTGGDRSLFGIYYTTRNRIFFIKKNFTLLYKYIALTYFYATRVGKYLTYSKEEKIKMIEAIRNAY